MEITAAVEGGDVAKVTELLKRDSEHDQDDLNKALVKAAEKKEWESVKLLVKAGANPNAKGFRYRALNFSSVFNNAECVDLLIKAGADVNYFNRTTCLHLTNDVEVAKLLIKAGADVNSMSYDEALTPLTEAASGGNADLVQLLIESGADVNHYSTYGTALGFAVGRDHPECVRILLPHVKNVDETFLQAAQYEHIECLKVFLEYGIDINEKRSITENRHSNKVTVLMKAASGGHIGCIEFLINKGACVDMLDDYGNNMLMFASMECKLEAMKYFIKLGMNVNASNEQNETALMKVIDQPYERYVYIGISSWEQNECKSECVKLLIESGAEVNNQSSSGDTPLNLAAKQNQPQYIKILLEAGAHINTFNDEGLNALLCHTARSKRKNQELKMLLFAAGESNKRFSSAMSHYKFKDDRHNDTNSDGTPTPTVLDIDWRCLSEEDANGYLNSLKEGCRNRIRAHLLQLNPFRSLFERVPLLGLPRALASYMLYDIDLELKQESPAKE